jgi:hypothetical protein
MAHMGALRIAGMRAQNYEALLQRRIPRLDALGRILKGAKLTALELIKGPAQVRQ